MKNLKQSLGSVALLALAGLTSGCGSTAYREGETQGQSPTAISDTSEPSTPAPTPTPTPTTGIPPYTYAFQIKGSESSTFTVDTDNLLKVRIRPDTAGLVGGTGYTAVYNCIKYTITAVGRSVPSAVLKVNGGSIACGDAVESQIINFSDRLGPGHNSVDVKVSAIQTDWKYMQCMTSPWLWLFPATSYMSCESYGKMNNLYSNHIATGVIDIQVNGTDL